jgi:cytochrome bd-type quinol oxidase subunit 1
VHGLTPSGFVAVLAGWFVTEVGRQPYIIYGVMRTAEAAHRLRATQVAFPWRLSSSPMAGVRRGNLLHRSA